VLIFDGQMMRLARERRNSAWHAWHTALLPRFKKTPDLDRFVERSVPRAPRQPKPRQTSEQQWAAFGAIAAVAKVINGKN
jgi:hypothetical protein